MPDVLSTTENIPGVDPPDAPPNSNANLPATGRARQARVEDVEDEDDDPSSLPRFARFTEAFPDAGVPRD